VKWNCKPPPQTSRNRTDRCSRMLRANGRLGSWGALERWGGRIFLIRVPNTSDGVGARVSLGWRDDPRRSSLYQEHLVRFWAKLSRLCRGLLPDRTGEPLRRRGRIEGAACYALGVVEAGPGGLGNV